MEQESLKPCPFHKEPVYPILYSGFKTEGTDDAGGWAELECPKCDHVAMSDYGAFTEDDAIKAVYELWNTRYKRTCARTHLSPPFRGGGYPASRTVCSVCGDRIGVHAKFCKNCGAEVVDD